MTDLSPAPLRDRPDATSDRPRAGRLPWVDVAKGASILLVVLHHASTKNLLVQLPGELGWVSQAWYEISTALKPVRMPLFFVLSGLVAAGAVRRPWRAARARFWGPAWLHLVWLPPLVVFFSVETTLPGNRLTGVTDVLADLLWASTSLWFLYALAVYFLLARAVVRLPRVPVLVVLALVAALATYVPTEHWNRFSVVFHAVYFVAGALAPDLVHAVAERVRRVPLVLLLGGYLLCWVGLDAGAVPVSTRLLVTSLVGVPLGLRVAQAATGRPAALLAALGRRTLPIYVLHLPLLGLAVHLPLPLGTSAAGALLAPFVLLAVVVPTTLLLHRGLLALGGTWLFALPAWVEPALDRLAGGRRARSGAGVSWLVAGAPRTSTTGGVAGAPRTSTTGGVAGAPRTSTTGGDVGQTERR
ncbi:acyltransferase family protein [Nocardioides bruguierae]|uniref:acyltransferase family protein n=1 Tax=Nocardioides bruguierae TaxID=2945102 RepID=UPI00201FC1B9|nr:acyltransferase [Nocardioides bruguierae]MCL8026156.1 acyltransferase [Nocardioides bruguierae]